MLFKENALLRYARIYEHHADMRTLERSVKLSVFKKEWRANCSILKVHQTKGIRFIHCFGRQTERKNIAGLMTHFLNDHHLCAPFGEIIVIGLSSVLARASVGAERRSLSVDMPGMRCRTVSREA